MKVKDENVNIIWRHRYSSTMEDDKMGRWARVAYAGKTNGGFPLIDGMICEWEIAWVKKIKDPASNLFLNKFIISPLFPFHGKYIFDSLEEAQTEVDKHFRHFIKCCVK